MKNPLTLLPLLLLSLLAFTACEDGLEIEDEGANRQAARDKIAMIVESGMNNEETRRSQAATRTRVAEAATRDSLRVFERINENGTFAFFEVGSHAISNPDELGTTLINEYRVSLKYGILLVLSDKKVVTETNQMIEALKQFCTDKGVDLWVKAPLSRDQAPYRRLVDKNSLEN